MSNFAIVVHGGAGTITPDLYTAEIEKGIRDTLYEAVEAGYYLLGDGEAAVNVVSHVVMVLENSPFFNAGKGAVFTNDGTHELEAAIMNGADLNAGAACGVKNIRNPVVLARKILEKSGHVYLHGKGAEEFGRLYHVAFEPDEYFFDQFRYDEWRKIKASNTYRLDHSKDNAKKFGTVGAVALDKNGNVAAATSTGGMTNKKYGRIGDSSIIGAGTYANNATCAVSCTGHGEPFLRAVSAYDVSCLMEYKGLPLEEATNYLIHEKMKQSHLQGEGGLIAVDTKGNISINFNTVGMYRGYRKSGEKEHIALYKPDEMPV